MDRLIKLGIATHLIEKTTGVSVISACGLVSPPFGTTIPQGVNCLNCLRTWAYKNTIKARKKRC